MEDAENANLGRKWMLLTKKDISCYSTRALNYTLVSSHVCIKCAIDKMNIEYKYIIVECEHYSNAESYMKTL